MTDHDTLVATHDTPVAQHDTYFVEPTEAGPLSADDIVFEVSSPGHWRIIDTRTDRTDVTAWLGFVEAFAGVYEVTLLGEPNICCFCASMNDVRSEVVNEPDRPGSVRGTNTTGRSSPRQP